MQRTAAVLSAIANGCAVVALVGIFGHIVVEMVLRNVFDTSTFVLDEFVGYGVSAMTFLALGHAYRQGALIRVFLVHEKLGSAGRRVLDTAGHLSALGVGLLIAVYLTKSMARNFDRGTTSSSIAEFPQWIPEAVVLAGVGVFLLQVLACLAETLMAPPRSVVLYDEEG